MAIGDLISRSGVAFAVAVQATEIETTGSPTGTFVAGETVTGGTSSATGELVYNDTANNFMYLRDVVGTFSNAETLTGGTSSATMTTGTVSQATAYSAFITVNGHKNAISISDTRGTETITDFSTAEDTFFDTVPGGRTGSMSWTMNTIPDDPAQGAMLEAYRGNLDVYVKVTPTSRDSTAYQKYEYGGTITDHSVSFNESGVAETSATLTFSSDRRFS